MRRVLIVLALVVAALGPAGAVPAQEVAAGEPILLILDVSGSMNRVEDGRRLIEIAQDALRQIVVQLPGDAQVGLRVYGHRTSNEDPVAGCVDTELVIPVGPLDREPVLDAIGSFDASGFTPIGLSLQEAARDLEATGGGTIILVSDGVDTCAPPDPCEVAEQLAREGVVTRVHSVGFRLDGAAAAEQLGCIAEVTHGSFTRIDQVDELVGGLTGLVNQTLEGSFVPHVDGGFDLATAPLLAFGSPSDPQWPALEAWVEGTIAAGEVRWYAVGVPEGFNLTAYASLDYGVSGVEDGTISIRIFDASGAEIGRPHEVLGQVVVAPATLLLVDGADYSIFGDPPVVEAVTAPRGAPPGWSAEEAWFAPTRERFAAAGLSGGLFTLWKEIEREPALEPGQYFVAFSWEAEVEAVSRHEIGLTAYPHDTRPPLVPFRAQHTIIRDPGDVSLIALEPVPWDGDPFEGGIAAPARSIEVWSPMAGGDVATFSVDLDTGEILAVGAVGVTPDMGGGWVEWRLLDPDGFQADDELEGPAWTPGFDNSIAWRAGSAGTFEVIGEVQGDDDIGLVTEFFVFPAEAAPVPTTDDILRDSFTSGRNGRAMVAGLEAVRAVAEG